MQAMLGELVGQNVERGLQVAAYHDGYGGSSGFADPAARFAFGLTKNRLVASPDGQGTAIRVARPIRDALEIAAAS
jgi:hypothetical protein